MSLFQSHPDDPPDRPAFDPEKMAPRPAPPPRADAPLRVSQLAERIDSALKSGLPARVRVIGEVTGMSDRTHWYFSLKDADAVQSCVMFASAAGKAGFTPENGQEVVATGSVSHFAKWGKTQLYVTRLEPVGAGALEIRYRQLVAEIRRLGWFADEHKKPIPRFPRRVAVVTARTSAALQDVLDTLRRRAPHVEVLTVDARMQGPLAAPQIVRALTDLGRRRRELGIDTVILTRGGGSMEDLWAFNERAVAEAVFRCPIPVIAAVGHETDTTIAELVADLRAATPTQAALRAAPDAAALMEMLDQLRARLAHTARRHLTHAQTASRAQQSALTAAARTALHTRSEALHRTAARLSRRHPAAVYAARRTTLDDLSDRLVRTLRRRLRAESPAPRAQRLRLAVAGRLQSARAHAERLVHRLDTAGPVATLRRGYSVTMTPAGRVLRSAADASPGDRLVTRLADGTLRSTVSGRVRRQKAEDAGPTLFDPGPEPGPDA